MARGVIVVGEKRSGYGECSTAAKVITNKMRLDNCESRRFTPDEDVKDVKIIPMILNKPKQTSNETPSMDRDNSKDDFECESSQNEAGVPRPVLKRLRRGPSRSCAPVVQSVPDLSPEANSTHQ
ncbi:hypothetical protein GUJ93_ZPchr0006g42217 [Zizania palustris]|uniref:Uncharacterized protein n=1 Tax=Zizania palustris TaxID=103762 RepID=A0A8J5W4A8_ZIZPA|nr:hypothetical protein GUJ93_ZPchr0006g42217 [Zizania palustris]